MSVTASALPGAERERLVRYAKLLAWSSLVWMSAEGVIAVVAGIAAGSIALIGFGIDSAIEGMASVVIVWRFWGSRALSEAAEQRAQKLVAVQLERDPNPRLASLKPTNIQRDHAPGRGRGRPRPSRVSEHFAAVRCHPRIRRDRLAVPDFY